MFDDMSPPLAYTREGILEAPFREKHGPDLLICYLSRSVEDPMERFCRHVCGLPSSSRPARWYYSACFPPVYCWSAVLYVDPDLFGTGAGTIVPHLAPVIDRL
jgi:hypothetical protein